jgi:hypothetical protein
MESVNEQSTCIVTASFKDENGNSVTPGAAWYSLYCETTGKEIVAEVALTGLSTSKDIEITPAQNTMQNVGNPSETKVVTLRFTYSGGSKQGTGFYKYSLINLERIT